MSARLFGTLLTWLNDHASDVFFVGTCNDISKLPPEFSRAERFDGIFFIDLPVPKEREAIWDMYLKKFDLNPKTPKPVDEGWTGAEIRACCRLAALLDIALLEAGKHIVPISVTAAESVERLRSWACGRCLAADKSGIFARDGGSGSRRRISRNPANN